MSSFDHSSLDTMIASLQAVGDMPGSCASDIADAWEDELKKQIRRGQDPDGAAWPVRKDDGKLALQDAANYLRVAAIGRSIFARLVGPIARHHKGIARGGIQRAILPLAGIPAATGRAIRRVLDQRFRDLVRS